MIVVLGLLVLAGCTGAPDRGAVSPTPTSTASPTPTATPTPTPTKSFDSSASDTNASLPQVSDTLEGLIAAENRTRYAEHHGLTLRNGDVKVVIELENGTTLPTGYGVDVQLRQNGAVQGFVPIGNIAELSKRSNVTFVRPPRTPEPMN